MRSKNKYLLLLLISTSILSTSCGKKDQAEGSKSDTQVVAKVNGDEILINQVNFQLSQLGQLNEAQSKAASKQVLARLIDQQLLKQQALEAKLDRDPRILQALESSKNQILAQAYLEQLISKAPNPSVAEIDGFYDQHPELFENRRVFRLQELVVEVSKDKFADIENSLKTIKGVNEIATWLTANHYLFTANSNVRAAEQLPLALLNKLQPMKNGEVVFVPTEGTFNIIHIAASQNAPIARDKAKPIIEQFFVNQNKSNLAKKEMLAINNKAKIEFSGAFSEMKKADLAKPAIASSTIASPTSTPINSKRTAVTEKSEQPAAILVKDSPQAIKPEAQVKTEQSNLDKGLSGL